MLVSILVLGLKPGQRKVVFVALKTNLKETKVAQFAGRVGDMAMYHHGEVSHALSF